MLRRLKDLLRRPMDPAAGLVLCGLASLVIWLCALYARDAFGSVVGGIITKPGSLPDGSLTWLMLLVYVPYIIAYRAVSRGAVPWARTIILGFAALISVALVAKVLPLVSYDLYLYVFQGRAVVMHGLNPYAVLPSSVQDPFVEKMGSWLASLKNTYGPLWTDICALIAAAVGDRPRALLVVFKAVAAAFFLACLPLLSSLMDGPGRRAGGPRRDAMLLLFVWNPSLLFEFGGNGHNDAAMIFFLLLALLFAVKKKNVLAGLALAASFLVKYMTLLSLPFFVAHAWSHTEGGRRAKARAVASIVLPALLAAIIFYAPYWIGSATFDGLTQQASHVGIDIASPFTYALALMLGGQQGMFDQSVTDIATPVSTVAFGVVSFLLVFAVFSRKQRATDLFRFVFAPMAFYLAFSCFWFMPWYLSWITPLLVLEGAAVAAVIFSLSGFLMYYAHYTGPLLSLALIATVLITRSVSRAAEPATETVPGL